ncbi:MAG: hypothetical protein ACRCX5_05310 [Bacteroidales bacterium]
MWIILNNEPFDSSKITEISDAFSVDMIDLIKLTESYVSNRSSDYIIYPLHKSFGSEIDILISENRKCIYRDFKSKVDDFEGYVFKIVYLEKSTSVNDKFGFFPDRMVTRYSKIYKSKEDADLALNELLESINKARSNAPKAFI